MQTTLQYATAASKERARSTLHILIVDDDVLHGRSVRDVLAAHNYPADVASAGLEGLRKLREAHASGNPYQVLVLDLHIPDLPGLKILEAIRDDGLAVKTVVLSGENDLSSVAPILNLGAYDYIGKPFQVPQLVTSVANALSAFQLEEQNAAMAAEAAENSQLYEFLLNASPDLVYLLDADGRFQFINAQLDNIFDVDYPALKDQPWQALFSGHDALIEDLSHHIDEMRTGTRATLGTEFSYTTNVGSRHTLELSSRGVYEGRSADDSGTFVGTYGVIRDITESQRTRQQLQQSQQKFYSLFIDSPDAVFIARIDDGAIVERNPNFLTVCQVMGVADNESDGFLWNETFTRAQFIAGLAQHPEHFDAVVEHHIQGEPRFFEVRARELLLEGERCMIASVRDRTHERRAEQDRLQLQQQLQQAARMEAIGQVAGGIAHDFNNILASIIGYAELVLNARQRLNEDQVNNYLDEVVTAGHRARDLISQMLTFTRAQRGETEAADITRTISDVSRMLHAAIPKTITIRTDFTENLPPVLVDPIQIQQIIINLLVNARDAISGNGHIDIRVAESNGGARCQTCGDEIDAGGVCITVADSGHGIEPALLDKVFEMYFTTRAPDQGTGFGLWMINNLVHEHHGHLTVESTVDVGTTFNIFLPPADAIPSSVEFPNVQVPKMSGRIVVVDDEVSVANFIGEVLRDKGYPTVVFTESPQALEYLKENLDKVALLLTDGSMPSISGLELVEQIKTLRSDLPVIYITAYTQSTDSETLTRLGVNTYLQKPFSIEAMLEAVAEHTNTHLEANSSLAAHGD